MPFHTRDTLLVMGIGGLSTVTIVSEEGHIGLVFVILAAASLIALRLVLYRARQSKRLPEPDNFRLEPVAAAVKPEPVAEETSKPAAAPIPAQPLTGRAI